MTEGLDNALREMLQERDTLIVRLKYLEQAIGIMQNLGGQGPQGGPPPVYPDQYRGMKLGAALDAYMKARRGFKLPAEKIAEDLKLGGVQAGPQHSLIHDIKLSVRQRRLSMAYDEKTWEVWLTEEANVAPKRRKR